MYIETPIGKLSKVQLNKLLKGKNVRIKSGTAHTLYLTEEQAKKIHKNISQKKSLTVKLNQEQIAKQGSGLLGDLIGLVHPTAGMVAKTVGLGMRKKQGKGLLGDLIGLVHPTAGMVAKTVGLGMKKKGKGMMSDLVNFGLQETTNALFRPRKGYDGKGFLGDLAKQAAINIAKSAGKFAVEKGTEIAKDKASEFLINKIEGLGMRKRKAATPAQLAALAKGRAIRDANRSGGALYVAGR